MEELKITIRNILTLLILSLIIILIEKSVFAGEMGIKINEVMFDPIGEDLGNEWIELYNPTDSTVVINNWKIQVAGTSFKDSATISLQIPAQSLAVVCEMNIDCNNKVSKLAFQNGGGATDGIQLVDSQGNVIDQVFYDFPNTNNLVDQLGNLVTNSTSAILGDSGETLGRINYQDSDDSGKDFVIFSQPTMGDNNLGVMGDSDYIPQTGDKLSSIFIPLLFLILIFSAMLSYSLKLFEKKNGKDNQKGHQENCTQKEY